MECPAGHTEMDETSSRCFQAGVNFGKYLSSFPSDPTESPLCRLEVKIESCTFAFRLWGMGGSHNIPLLYLNIFTNLLRLSTSWYLVVTRHFGILYLFYDGFKLPVEYSILLGSPGNSAVGQAGRVKFKFDF